MQFSSSLQESLISAHEFMSYPPAPKLSTELRGLPHVAMPCKPPGDMIVSAWKAAKLSTFASLLLLLLSDPVLLDARSYDEL
jgi:hypothetical protein